MKKHLVAFEIIGKVVSTTFNDEFNRTSMRYSILSSLYDSGFILVNNSRVYYQLDRVLDALNEDRKIGSSAAQMPSFWTREIWAALVGQAVLY